MEQYSGDYSISITVIATAVLRRGSDLLAKESSRILRCIRLHSSVEISLMSVSVVCFLNNRLPTYLLCWLAMYVFSSRACSEHSEVRKFSRPGSYVGKESST
jgi:hypothetical protein